MTTLDQFIRALYCLCKDYHSGQWSRSYELLCHCLRYAKQWHIDLVPLLSHAEEQIYRRLEIKYSTRL